MMPDPKALQALSHAEARPVLEAENERLRAQVARLRAALTKAERLAEDGVKAERWSIERGVLHEQIAKLAHATLAETEEGA